MTSFIFTYTVGNKAGVVSFVNLTNTNKKSCRLNYAQRTPQRVRRPYNNLTRRFFSSSNCKRVIREEVTVVPYLPYSSLDDYDLETRQAVKSHSKDGYFGPLNKGDHYVEGEHYIPRPLNFSWPTMHGIYNILRWEYPESSYFDMKRKNKARRIADEVAKREGRYISPTINTNRRAKVRTFEDTIGEWIDYYSDILVNILWVVFKIFSYIVIICSVPFTLMCILVALHDPWFVGKLSSIINFFYQFFIGMWQSTWDILGAEVEEISSSKPDLITLKNLFTWFLFLWIKLIKYSIVGFNFVRLGACVAYIYFTFWTYEMVSYDPEITVIYMRHYRDRPFLLNAVFQNRGYMLGANNYDVLTESDVEKLRLCVLDMYGRFLDAIITVWAVVFWFSVVQYGLWFMYKLFATEDKLTFVDFICMIY